MNRLKLGSAIIILLCSGMVVALEVVPDSEANQKLHIDAEAIKNCSPLSAVARDLSSISHYNVNSDIMKQATLQLQQSQINTAYTDNGADIVFCMNDGVWVQKADGSGRRRIITRGTGYRGFFYPAWSPDGTQIAFGAQQTDKRVVDLVVANADGSSPHVILTLAEGYYTSLIQSISWFWDSQYIMFSYIFDDVNLNSVFVICTIRRDGSNFVVGPGPKMGYCQYEPQMNSTRYAYIMSGTPLNMNTELHTANLDGSSDLLWYKHPVISGMTHIAWNNASSIYSIIRGVQEYPNREVLVDFRRTGAYVIAYSGQHESLWSPTVAPDKSQLYISELRQNGTSYMNLINLGNPISIKSVGVGAYPNWRQNKPTSVNIRDDRQVIKIPQSCTLLANFPNPFNPSTTIRYSMQVSGFVQLDIYDIKGKHIESLYSGNRPPGYYEIKWDAANYSCGTYLCRLVAIPEKGREPLRQTAKLLLIK